MPTVEGARVERRSTDIVVGSVRPLRDHVLVEVLDWKPSKIIEVAGNQRKPLRGRVVAVGPGSFPWKYNHDRSKRRESKSFVRTEVKPGDVVELGGLELGGYTHYPQFVKDNKLYVLPQEADICGIVEC